MANHTSAKKAIRQTFKKTANNKSRMSKIRTFIKKVALAIANNSQEEVKTAFINAQSEIMKGVSHDLIKPNTASRKVSNLAKQVKNFVLVSSKATN